MIRGIGWAPTLGSNQTSSANTTYHEWVFNKAKSVTRSVNEVLQFFQLLSLSSRRQNKKCWNTFEWKEASFTAQWVFLRSNWSFWKSDWDNFMDAWKVWRIILRNCCTWSIFGFSVNLLIDIWCRTINPRYNYQEIKDITTLTQHYILLRITLRHRCFSVK